MQKNAYFRLNTKEDGTYLAIYPPTGDGEALALPLVRQYLGKIDPRLLAAQDLAGQLSGALSRQHEETEIKLSDQYVGPVDEIVLAAISEDSMKASAVFFPPSEQGRKLDKKSVIEMLEDARVRFGIDEGRIEQWLEDRRYCTDVPVAEGVPPEESRDAVIEYMFETRDVFRPTIEQDGSVNFHELNLLNDVAQGDELAVLTPDYRGNSGRNVLGRELPSAKPLRKKLKYGKNALLSEDGCRLTAAISGYVELAGEKVDVYGTYSIKGNVGTATGDVDFDGIVKISGDVLTGYAVKASVDILVQGVVEGANLKAGRDIVIGSGVHGIAKANIDAGGDVTANFIQEGTVRAGGSVRAGSILYSKVAARDSICVNTGKGLVKGGELRATGLIQAKTVGAALTGGNAQLAVGTDPNDIAEMRKLETKLAEKRAEQAKLVQSLSFLKRKAGSEEALKAEHQRLMKVLPAMISAIAEEIEDSQNKHDSMKLVFERSNTGKVVIEGTIYEGSTVVISNATYYVNEDLAQCQFCKRGAEIAVASL